MAKNRYWGRKLADDYENKTGRSRRSGIRLPDENHIQFDGEKEHVTVTMEQKAIISNLQTNAAAFEAWSLALRVWSEVKKIDLVWKPPVDCTENERCHYQRFLYRAKRFHSLFPEWFGLAKPELLAEAEALGDGPLYLNVARDRGQRTDHAGKREAKLENALLASEVFKGHFGLKDREPDRQIPVGLFRESVAQRNRIFTGGFTDMVGIARDVLWLFELKAGDNTPAGILSELFFYASVMRDAIGPNARFRFQDRSTARGTTVRPEDIRRCSRIEAVLLGERLHPLIGHADVIRCLNEAATRNWNVSRDSIPVNFRGATLKCSGADYLFANLEMACTRN